MSSLFTARRKPKRIGRDDSSEPAAEDEENAPVVRRPGAAKQKSKLRVAFDPEDDPSAIPSDSSTATKPTKPRASTALQDKLRDTSLRDPSSESRPSYSKSALDELRNSTPSTPLSLTHTPPDTSQLDLASKFPNQPFASNATHIPSSTEIAALKARRLRAAHESTAEDFIPLDDDQLYDSDGEFKPQRLQVGTYLQPEKERDTRLVRDDEDVMEGFETFVEDINPGGRIQMDLSKRAERQRWKRERQDISAQIAAAEDTDSNASEYDSDDAELHAQYQDKQFHAGLDGLSGHREYEKQRRRPKQPKVTTPIEKLSMGLGRLREQVARIEMEKGRLERRKGEIVREREELMKQREHVQMSLEEASRELERVDRMKAGEGVNGGEERGLDSLGTRVNGEADGL